MRRAAILAGLAALAAGCGSREPEPAVPAFAAALPGHTVAVAWGEEAGVELLRLPAAAAAGWLGLTAVPAPSGVAALGGDATAVGWASLARNTLFAAAVAAAPSGERHLFVDLQQVVDLLARALAAPADPRRSPAMLPGMVAQRAIDALRLRSLQWLIAAERRGGEDRQVEAVVAAAAADGGLFGVLGTGGEAPWPSAWPAGGADVRLLLRFSPTVLARVVRDLASADDGGMMQMVREVLRGKRVEAALAALDGLRGTLAMTAGRRQGWLWLSLAAPDAVADALDEIAAPAADGWELGPWQLSLQDGALVGRIGDQPRDLTPLPAERPGLWLELPRAGQQWSATREVRPERWRVHGRRRD